MATKLYFPINFLPVRIAYLAVSCYMLRVPSTETSFKVPYRLLPTPWQTFPWRAILENIYVFCGFLVAIIQYDITLKYILFLISVRLLPGSIHLVLPLLVVPRQSSRVFRKLSSFNTSPHHHRRRPLGSDRARVLWLTRPLCDVV